MSNLSELLAELKALQPAYAEADKRAMEAGAWSDEEWAVNRKYWAIADQLVAEMRSVVGKGKLIRVLKTDGKDLWVGTVGACFESNGFPMVLYAPQQNAEWTIQGLRLDFVESMEVVDA